MQALTLATPPAAAGCIWMLMKIIRVKWLVSSLLDLVQRNFGTLFSGAIYVSVAVCLWNLADNLFIRLSKIFLEQWQYYIHIKKTQAGINNPKTKPQQMTERTNQRTNKQIKLHTVKLSNRLVLTPSDHTNSKQLCMLLGFLLQSTADAARNWGLKVH